MVVKHLSIRSKVSQQVEVDWQLSIERIDEDGHDTEDNCHLICMEFQNGYIQWSYDKVSSHWPYN